MSTTISVKKITSSKQSNIFLDILDINHLVAIVKNKFTIIILTFLILLSSFGDIRYELAFAFTALFIFILIIYVTFFYGIYWGLVSSFLMVSYSLISTLYSSQDINFGNHDFQHTLALALILPVVTLIINKFKNKINSTLKKEIELRKIAEIANSRYKTIFDDSPLAIQIFDSKGKLLQVNKSWKKYWTLSVNRLKKYNVWKDKEISRKGLLPYFKRAYLGETLSLPPTYYETNKNNYLNYSAWLKTYIYPIIDMNGKVTEVIVTYDDITKDKQLEYAVRQNQEFLQAIFDLSPAVVAVKNTEGKYIFVNKYFEERHKSSKEQLIGKTAYDIFPKDIADKINQDDKKVIRLKKPIEVEELVPTPEGSVYNLTVKFPIINDQGEVTSIAAIATDITYRKQTEKRKDQFLSIASHELKTPITTVKGYTQILQTILSKNTKANNYLLKMDDQVNRMVELVNDMLDISRISSGKLELKREELNIDDIVKEVSRDMQQANYQHKIIINTKSQVNVLADKHRICQVIINLLSNAIKYSPNGEKVYVSTKVERNSVVVSVQDFGVGISKAEYDKIFEPFYQGDRRKNGASGLGLGLNISKEIVGKHKGKIWVESKINKGSTFYFSLPILKK